MARSCGGHDSRRIRINWHAHGSHSSGARSATMFTWELVVGTGGRHSKRHRRSFRERVFVPTLASMNKRVKALEPKAGPSEKAVPGLVLVFYCTQSSQLIQPLLLAPLPLALLLRLKLTERALPASSPRERPAGRSTKNRFARPTHCRRFANSVRRASRSHLYDDPCGAVRCPRVNGRPGLFERLVPDPRGPYQ